MKKHVFFFGNGKSEGRPEMRSLLGGKGAGLAGMTNAKLPVPPGFTIATTACKLFFDNGFNFPQNIKNESVRALNKLQKLLGQKFGSITNPLFLSVRSGGLVSMPGMMDTILNLGMNDKTVEALARKSNNSKFAYDCYRRFIQMFGNVVMKVPKESFDGILDKQKKRRGITADSELGVEDLKKIVGQYKQVILKEKRQSLPQDPIKQLDMARDAVFYSWYNPRAKVYRRLNKIPENLGTAVNVQVMVFGNMGSDSGTGVGFTRNPSTGDKEFYGEFLMNAQGEDVVAGVRTPLPIAGLKKKMPKVYAQLKSITSNLERHYKDMQDFEFTIQNKILYMLQTRVAKRTGIAAVKLAVDMVKEGLITKEEAVSRVEPSQLDQFLHPVLGETKQFKVVAKGLPASPGAGVGRIVLTADEAVRQSKNNPVILVRAETTPDDIHGMESATGILTSRGGMTSHAAVVTRGMGKCCVVGCSNLEINTKSKVLKIGSCNLKEGDWVSLDGSSGRVFVGKVPVNSADLLNKELSKFMKWVDSFRKLKIRANADIPRDAKIARQFGAEGIGLCRTEHMFFSADRLPYMQEMIMSCKESTDAKKMAYYKKARLRSLSKLLPMQRKDFMGLFKAMRGLPVTIRLLDPPLHEFLPKREELMVEIASLEVKKGNIKKIISKKKLLEVINGLHELNPMLGMRGCRLGNIYPEITEMQARAIFEAACQCKKQGIRVFPEVMVPLAGDVRELKIQKEIIDRVAQDIFSQKKLNIKYLVGTMVELPAAALSASEIAKEADFFSFGTNDLTQTTFGLSRDDCGKIINAYLQNKVWQSDPFQVLDKKRVGRLVEIGTKEGRLGRSNLKVGICGEHGGDPASIEFFSKLGLNYVSCSAYRVPIARLASAQAELRRKQ